MVTFNLKNVIPDRIENPGESGSATREYPLIFEIKGDT